MKRAVPILLTFLAFAALVAVVFLYISLSSKQRQLNDQISGLELLLKAGADKYTRCYYSVNNGSYLVSDVSLEHLQWNSTDIQKAQLDMIELDFMNGVKEQCNNVISAYESTHAEYRKILHDSAASGWITFLIGGKQVNASQTESLESLRFRTGDALSYFIFTKNDIENYFNHRLANG